MSCHISIGLLEDLRRLTTTPQNFLLKIQSYNHSIVYSPSVSLDNPNWNYSYTLAGSDKEIIRFFLCSLHQATWMQVLATARFDLRGYLAEFVPPTVSNANLFMESKYTNEVILHLRCQFKQQKISRNQGLIEVRKPQQKLKQNQPKTNRPEDPKTIFIGPCENRNLFSFMDGTYQGQSFLPIEPIVE